MDNLIDVKWHEMLVPDTALLEIFIRGTLVYFALFILLRVILKRETGGVGVTDLLVIVLIADAAQNAMAGEYTSVPDGILLVATIIGWSFFLDWLSFHSEAARKILNPAPLPLIERGRLLRDNMAHELMTEDELRSQVRLQGIDDLGEVRIAIMEPDGRISVIPFKKDDAPHPAPEKQM